MTNSRLTVGQSTQLFATVGDNLQNHLFYMPLKGLR